MLVLPKNYLNYLKDSLFECLFKEYKKLFFFFKKKKFSQYIMMQRLSLEEENVTKDIRNLFRLKKN